MKRINKYLVITVMNVVVLLFLLRVGADFVEVTFNSSIWLLEVLKIIGVTLISLLGIQIMIAVFRKNNAEENQKKFKYAVSIVLSISSFLYYSYVKKIYENRIINNSVRKELARKIRPANRLANGTMAKGLTNEQYKEITKLNWFPKLQQEAENISYLYSYDGFLPDYSFEISYDIPKEIKADTLEFKYGKLYIDIKGDKKRITYKEYND